MLNVRANMLMKSAVIVLDEFTDFPGSPAKGTLCFKDEILYMYCSLDGIDSWYPLTNRNSYHIHIQGGASSGWNISHGLGTKDLIIAVYDDSDVQQTPSGIIFTDNDQITLSFTQAIAGRAVIVSAADQYTVNITNMIEEVDGDIQFKNDLIPDTDNAYDIGSMASRVKDIYVSGGTIYVGDQATIKEDEIVLNGDATGTQFGFRVQRSGQDDGLFYFDENDGDWKFGDASSVRSMASNDGTDSAEFQIAKVNGGPILKNNGGDLQIRNGADTDFASLEVENLTVRGITTTVESETVTFADNTLLLNSDFSGPGPSENGGVEVERGDEDNASLVFDESDDVWKAGIVGSEGEIYTANKDNLPDGDNTRDLGSNSYRYKEVHAVDFIGEASSATYADLAEVYKIDRQYKVGTVVRASEDPMYDVQAANIPLDGRIVGVVSENPAYLMNRDEQGLPIALTGKVPVRVLGAIKKSDVIVPAGEGMARAMQDPSEIPFKMGCAVEENLDSGEKLVMCIIR